MTPTVPSAVRFAASHPGVLIKSTGVYGSYCWKFRKIRRSSRSIRSTQLNKCFHYFLSEGFRLGRDKDDVKRFRNFLDILWVFA
jgi:hypothetical protein